MITRNTNDERDFIIYGDDGRIYKFETKEYEEKIFESGTEGYPKAWRYQISLTHPPMIKLILYMVRRLSIVIHILLQKWEFVMLRNGVRQVGIYS